jgi:hypothetical protein
VAAPNTEYLVLEFKISGIAESAGTEVLVVCKC